MDYARAMLLVVVFLGPVALVGAAILLPSLIKWRAVPADVPYALSLLTLAATLFGAYMLGSTIDSHVYRPARLQDEFLGGRYASVLALRTYDAWGFQDPGQRWTYALDPATAAGLRRSCRWITDWRGRHCLLFNTMDDRYYGLAALDGDVLVIESGLW